MSDTLTPEREKYIIDQVSRTIIQYDIEDIAIAILEGTAPYGEAVGELGVMSTYPFMVTFFGQFGQDLINMLGFDYTKNANKLKERIAELKKEKERLQELERKKEAEAGKKDWFSRLKSFFG